MDAPKLERALISIQTEYVEMPTLKLTLAQAQRLWSLPTDLCHTALAVLVERRFLAHARDGAYVRRGVPSSVQSIESLLRAM